MGGSTRFAVLLCLGIVLAATGAGADGLSTIDNQLWHQDSPDIDGVAESQELLGSALATGDFDGDGFEDLAIGVPGESPGSSTLDEGGAVNVIYGSATGLVAAGDQMWHQNKAGIADATEPGDEFGSSLAAGDFDNDGYDDLAVGVPFEDLNGSVAAGAVNVLYGSDTGLTNAGDQFWHQDSSGMEGNGTGSLDLFGYSLTTGDFDGDDYDDLAISAPREELGGLDDAGVVHVLYGGESGLSTTRDQVFEQGEGGLPDDAEADDWFGQGLTAGDFDGDGHDDLAMGAPSEDLGGASGTGVVAVVYGSDSGLDAARSELWHQDTPGILGVNEPLDRFGHALAAGDMNGDGTADLAIMRPGQELNTFGFAGAASVIYGSDTGLTTAGDQSWGQDLPAILGDAWIDERFGLAAVVGDFSGDGFADLAIGVPNDDRGVDDTGAVNVLYGGDLGLTHFNDQYWHRDVPGILGGGGLFADRFGSALAAGDFDGDGFADLAVGVPYGDVGTAIWAGSVNVLYGGRLCGDGTIGVFEQCDDGGNEAGDCCSTTCQYEFGPGAPPCCSFGICQVGLGCGALCFEAGTCQLGGATGDTCLCAP